MLNEYDRFDCMSRIVVLFDPLHTGSRCEGLFAGCPRCNRWYHADIMALINPERFRWVGYIWVAQGGTILETRSIKSEVQFSSMFSLRLRLIGVGWGPHDVVPFLSEKGTCIFFKACSFAVKDAIKKWLLFLSPKYMVVNCYTALYLGEIRTED